MKEEDLKNEEEKAKNLANFLKENAIKALIKSFQKNEGVPTDS